MLQAREKARELGLSSLGAGCGALLRVFTAAIAAQAVVEIGTGTGASGIWLLRGMLSNGVLTTIDVEAEPQQVARAAFVEAGFKPSRTRVITGRALEVLPRLTDGGYDLVFVDGAPEEFAEYLEQSIRLLRPGGTVIVNNALWRDHVADPARRDATTTTVRELGKSLRADERLHTALVPVGNGLLFGTRL